MVTGCCLNVLQFIFCVTLWGTNSIIRPKIIFYKIGLWVRINDILDHAKQIACVNLVVPLGLESVRLYNFFFGRSKQIVALILGQGLSIFCSFLVLELSFKIDVDKTIFVIFGFCLQSSWISAFRNLWNFVIKARRVLCQEWFRKALLGIKLTLFLLFCLLIHLLFYLSKLFFEGICKSILIPSLYDNPLLFFTSFVWHYSD